MALLQIMVVTGEASGDQHAAHLVEELQRRRPEARFFGMGGPKLAARGVELIYGAHELSVMGITEVVPKLRRILQVMRGLERCARRRQPACAILVDIPDFNLRLARSLKRMGIPVVYYVSPKVWATRSGRVNQVGARVDRMLCILPFEEAFYRRMGIRVQYVGNPVLDQLPPPAPAVELRARLGLDPNRPTLALLPGSRMQEIRRLLPTLVEVARELGARRKGLQTLLPVAPGIPREEISRPFAGSGVEPVLLEGRAPEAVGASDVAVVASGTAVLEASLMERPLVVVYRVSALTALIGRLILRIPYVSLANLLAGRRIVPELLQGQMRVARIVAELERVWDAGPERERMLQDLREVRLKLGPPGASSRAADAVVGLLPG